MLALSAWLVPTAVGAAAIGFVAGGQPPVRLGLDQLLARCEPRVVEVDDPYYGRRMAFHALALGCAFEAALGALPGSDENVLLRARDGYTRPASGALLAEGGVWLAFGDAALSAGEPGQEGFVPRWEPIDRRQVDPAPFYLVWTGVGRNDPHRHPWPYQLAEIEIAPLSQLYPHVAPAGVPAGAPADRGFAIFRSQCIACHAINGEGGTVGPDLNVPRSIVEYRPVEQIKAYIRDPTSFRYTTMPAQPDLSDAELDALVAYFTVMSAQKHDPGAR